MDKQNDITDALKIAHEYFDASNRSDFDQIERLMSPHITYTSATTGMYIGRAEVLEMQRVFHDSYESLKWRVNSVAEEKPGIVVFDYTFTATSLRGDTLTSEGLEYILVADGQIQHIEIRGK